MRTSILSYTAALCFLLPQGRAQTSGPGPAEPLDPAVDASTPSSPPESEAHPVGADVASADEAPIRLPVTRIDRAGVTGGPLDNLQLPTESATSSQVGWTARLVNAGPWVTLLGASGTTPNPVRLRFSPSGAGSPGLYQATLEVSAGGTTLLIPISYALDELNVTSMVTDPLRSVVYGLNDGEHGGGVVAVNPYNGSIAHVIRVGRRPSGIAFSPDGSEIYVGSSIDPVINRINPATREVTRSIDVPGSADWPADNFPAVRIAAGRNGRLYHVNGDDDPLLRVIDFNTGTLVATLRRVDLPAGAIQNHVLGDLFLDPREQRLYFTLRRAITSSPPLIGVLDVSNDQPVMLGEFPTGTLSTSFSTTSRILADLNGERLFFNRQAIHRNPWSGSDLPFNVVGLSAYGDLAVGSSYVYDPRAGRRVADLDPINDFSVFTPDQTGLLQYSAILRRFAYWPLPLANRPPPVALRPEPPAGGTLTVGDNTLNWSGLPMVDGYRVYLGTNLAMVTSAQPGSPLDRGVVTRTSFVLDPVLAAGTYYWRVDALRGGTVIPGAVTSFSAASFRVTPSELVVTSPLGARAQTVTLQPENAFGAPVSWSATTTNGWIRLPGGAGAAGQALVVEVNPSGLAAGTHAGKIRVTHAGDTVEVPLQLTVFEADLTRLAADPQRPIVYGLDPGVNQQSPTYVVMIDSASGDLLGSIPLAESASEIALHPLEDRLYLLAPNGTKLQVLDLASRKLLAPVALPAARSYGSIAAGRAGRIFVNLDLTSRWETRQIDTATGSDLGALPRGVLGTQASALASDPAGLNLYAASSGKIQRMDVAQDTPVLLESGLWSGAGTTVFGSMPYVSRGSGRVACGRTVFDAGLRQLGSTVRDSQVMTGDGQIVLNGLTLCWADGGLEAGTLPFTVGSFGYDNVILAISADDRRLVAWHRTNKRATSLELTSLADLPGPIPRPGQQLAAPPSFLSWSPVAGATGYRVFFGVDESAVGAAGPGSNLLIGAPTDNRLDLSLPFEAGHRYHWRVDVVTPSGVVKGTLRYFDLPFVQGAGPILQVAHAFASGPDGLAIGTTGTGVELFRLDPQTGAHSRVQSFKPYGTNHRNKLGKSIAMTPGALIAGDIGYDKPVENTGGVFVMRQLWTEEWKLGELLPDPPDASLDYVGGTLAFDANQLLVGVGHGFYANSPGRVFPWFEFPRWRRGPELVPSVRVQADYFGAAIALDGTRALIGAPGSGQNYNRRGSAFIFEYDAALKKWTETALLQPAPGDPEDQAGGALALRGDLAVVGSKAPDSQTGLPIKKVYIFSRSAPGSWVQTAVIEDPARAFRGNFGSTVVLHGDLLFIADPGATWRGQWGGLVHVYRRQGDNWLPMAPIVPPPASENFGAAMTVCQGWLLASQSKLSGSDVPARVLLYRIGELANHPPVFVTSPPTQVVNGKVTEIQLAATDPDGDAGLGFGPANLPPGLSLEDLGNGRARIVGIPSDPAGTERWIRIMVKDAAGAEAVQTAIVATLSGNDLPVPGGLPASLEIQSGEDLQLTVSTAGTGPFTWQWRRDGIDIPGADGPQLLVTNAGEEMTGSFTVTVANVVGSVTSAPVAVTVRPAGRMAGDWTTFGGSAEHDGHQAATLGRHIFQPVWQSSPALPRALNQPAVAGGTVFVTPNPNGSTFNSQVLAYNLATGDPRWSHPLGQLSWANPPSWHGGRLYVQCQPLSTGARLWCLDGTTGAVVWQSNSSQLGKSEAPAVDDTGIYLPANSGTNGMQAFNLSGQSIFSSNRPRLSGWTPALSGGRLFSWVGGEFVEHDRGNGTALWTLKPAWVNNGSAMNTVAVVRGGRAYLGGNAGLSCLDLVRPRVLWNLPGTFQGSPAFAAGRVFVLDGTGVRALSAADGSELAFYQTGAAMAKPLIGQALLLNDHLIACNTDSTFVFHLQTARLVQTIPHGGFPAYSGGHLVLAGSDGVLRAYFANAAPEFTGSMPATIDAGAAAGDLILPVATFAGDPDPGDPLTWSIKSVSRPELFRTLEIHAQSGDLTVVYNPWQSGESDVTLAVTDSAGNVTESTITFSVPEHPVPRLEVAAKLVLNRQTGLYEHAITVTNSGAREIAGFDLKISGLPEGVVVNNASGRDGNDWIIQLRQPLAAGASVNLVVEYHAAVRGAVIDPQVTVAAVTEPERHPDAPAGGLAVERCVVMPDSSVMVEFSTTPGALYEIHYSDDAVAWKLSPVRVRAAGNRVQWIDSGPPRTETSPSGEPCRFYRVREVPAS